jgi:shikimate dehydrogenase
MAVHQAADAFELVTGRAADRDAMSTDFEDLVAHEVGAATPVAEPDHTAGTDHRS